MSSYSLDYSGTRPNRPRLRQQRRSFLAPISLFVSGVSLVYACALTSEYRRLHRDRDAYALRYDSLLAAKLRADYQLLRLEKSQNLPRPDPAGLSNGLLIRP